MEAKSFQARVDGKLLGRYATFEEATAAVDKTKPPHRKSVALVMGEETRMVYYEAIMECTDSGANVLAWRCREIEAVRKVE